MWTNEPDLHIVVDGCHIRGKEYKLPASTTDLDKAKFGEYLEKICALTNVPLPDPEAAGYISNYDKPKT